MPFELDLTPTGSMQVESHEEGPLSTNTYLVMSEGEAIVIDPAWKGERICARIAEEHPDVRIRAIVCTHCHGDHVGGVAGMRRELGDGVPFVISAVDAPYLEAAVTHMRGWGLNVEQPPAPDRLLHEGDVVEVGSVRLQVIETPGHTRGGIVLFAATRDGDTAFVGDTLFPGSHGRTDLDGGDDAAIMASLGKLGRMLPVDTLVCAGHGPVTTIARERETNPFMQLALKNV